MSLARWAAAALVVAAATGAATANSTDDGGSAADTGPVAGIPQPYLDLYRANAGRCEHLDWPVLAAVGYTESTHGQNPGGGVHSGQNAAGERGPMQFTPGEWDKVRAKYPEIPDLPYDPGASVQAAAWKLCDDGVRDGDTDQALLRYNGSPTYVIKVTDKIGEYRGGS